MGVFDGFDQQASSAQFSYILGLYKQLGEVEAMAALDTEINTREASQLIDELKERIHGKPGVRRDVTWKGISDES